MNKNLKQNQMQTKDKHGKGFTLIELLIVVAIIGLLASIVLVTVSRARKKAIATQMKGHISEVTKAIEMAGADGCTSITVAAGGTISCTPAGASGAVTFMATIPSAPSGATYTYPGVINPTTGTYTLTASGFENGQTFTCSGGGCSCSTANGCLAIP